VGPGWMKKKKAMVQHLNSNNRTFHAPKMTNKLLEQDQTTKNTIQQQELKKLLRISHRNPNKTTISKHSKNFMAWAKHHKIEKKYFKFII
jgi:hypothetical protein